MGQYFQLKMDEGTGGMQATHSIQNNQEKLANMETYINIGNFKISKKSDEHHKKE